MPKFLGYTTYDNGDAVVLTEAEHVEKKLPDDWAEYVWIKAGTKAEAYARYDEAMGEYEADNEACRPIKEYY